MRSYVRIDFTRFEYSQTGPTDMDATPTGHMVTPTRFLNPNRTTRTSLVSTTVCQLVIETFLFFWVMQNAIFNTGHIFVVFRTRRTRRHEAGGTGDDTGLIDRLPAIRLYAIWRLAISELSRIFL